MRARYRLSHLLILLVGCLSALPALAQDPNNERRRWELFAQGAGSFHSHVSGIAVIQGTQPPLVLNVSKSFAKTGRFFTGLPFHFDSKNHIEASYSYSPGRLNVKLRGFPLLQPQTIVVWLDYDYFSFNYVRRLPGRPKLKPFVTAGFGIVIYNHGFSPGRYNIKPLANIGVGCDIPVHRRFSLRFEQRVFITGTPSSGAGVLSAPDLYGIKGKTYDFVPSVGLVWHF